MTNAEVRRQLGGMPTGPNDMREMRFTVKRHWERLVQELACWPQQTQEQRKAMGGDAS